MARADLLKRLFLSYQKRDEKSFRSAADELIEEERKKQHPVLANELERILRNGNHESVAANGFITFEPPPHDAERRTSLMEVRHTRRYLDDLVLSDTTRKSMTTILREFCEWDVLSANGLQPTRRVLFCGPSGCGKTATAEAMATEVGLPLLYVRFDSVVSSLLGETAANLRKVFDYAKRGQWVILFDEFDAIGRSRDDATEHGEIKRVVNSFLQILDNFDGRSLVIAATNFEQSLDPAIWRRFDEVVRFEKPTADQIIVLVRKLLANVRYGADYAQVIASSLADGSFADAERLCFDIRKSCILRGSRQVADNDVAEAVTRHLYRKDVLRKATSNGNPNVDEE